MRSIANANRRSALRPTSPLSMPRRLPDRKLVAGGIVEVKAPPAGEREDRFRDGTARRRHGRERGLEVVGVDHGEGNRERMRPVRVEPNVDGPRPGAISLAVVVFKSLGLQCPVALVTSYALTKPLHGPSASVS